MRPLTINSGKLWGLADFEGVIVFYCELEGVASFPAHCSFELDGDGDHVLAFVDFLELRHIGF